MFVLTVDDYVDDVEGEEEDAAARTFPGGALQQQFASYRAAGWSELPKDILGLIVDRLLFLPDLNQFASVCVACRSMALEKRNLFAYQPPLLMVSYEEDTQTSTFFCLSDREFYNLHLPELRQSWCCGSSNGWLIILDDGLGISLLNPFSRAQIQLPPHPMFSDLGVQNVTREGSGLWKHNLIHKVIISDNPIANPNCLVMAVVLDMNKFSFCRLGDETWTVLETDSCWDATFYEGHIYASSFTQSGLVHDIDADHNTKAVQRVEMTNVPPGSLEGEEVRYFVNSSGGLLHVIRYWKLILYDEGEPQLQAQPQNLDDIIGDGDGYDDDAHNDGNGGDDENSNSDGYREEILNFRPYYKTVAFQVFKLDQEKQGSDSEWIELKSLGDRALFLGGGHSLSVSVSNIPNCKTNCIYFMDDNYEGCLTTVPRCSDMGMFNMMDGSMEPFPIAPIWSALPFWLTQNPW